MYYPEWSHKYKDFFWFRFNLSYLYLLLYVNDPKHLEWYGPLLIRILLAAKWYCSMLIHLVGMATWSHDKPNEWYCFRNGTTNSNHKNEPNVKDATDIDPWIGTTMYRR